MEFTINVNEVEELQMINNVPQLEQMFTRAQSTIVQGGTVALVRKDAKGSAYRFDELTTEEDLKTYKQTVLKYL